MYCDSFACSMSIRTCKASCALAKEAIRLILGDEQSLFQLDDISINRMIVCGKCPCSGINPLEAKKAFRSSISTMAEKISRYDEWGLVPEVSQERKIKVGRKYRKRHEEEITGRAKNRRTTNRIEQLKDQIRRNRT